LHGEPLDKGVKLRVFHHSESISKGLKPEVAWKVDMFDDRIFDSDLLDLNPGSTKSEAKFAIYGIYSASKPF
jgi:hypothetical protein